MITKECLRNRLYDRQIYKYPPYFRLIKITLKHRDFDKLKEGAMWLYQVMSQALDMPVFRSRRACHQQNKKRVHQNHYGENSSHTTYW